MNLVIDRIELTLDGVSPSDARLLSSELPAALETRLGVARNDADASTGSHDDDSPLETALRGRALVEAIAARIADAIGDERRRAEAGPGSATAGAGPAVSGHEETRWL